ncbi:MAG TPA: TPM domain-containing protein [Caldimonas sp.]|nr:TPM domain-containing protein [Caldimonas sp.]
MACSLAALAFVAAAEPPVPALGHRVTDLTATLDSREQHALATELERIETTTGARVLVLIIDSLDGEAISAYATRVFDAWKPGRAGIDDGVLIVLAKNERRVRIEVGRGLEGAIPDILSHRIAADFMAPAFGRGEFAKGFTEGSREIGRLIAIERRSPTTDRERSVDAVAARPARSGGEPWYFFAVLSALILLAAGLAMRRRRGDALPPIFTARPLTEKEIRFLQGLSIPQRAADTTKANRGFIPTNATASRSDGGGYASGDSGSASASANTYDASSSAGTSAGGGSETSY